MPPKTKIAPEDIVAAALEVVRANGAEALNARAVAKKLNCSTQPIFSNYSRMEDLKADVMQKAKQLYQQYIEKGMKGTVYPPYKASGIAYIQFAKEEKELFKLLFMRDRSQEEIKEEREEISGLLKLISCDTGMSLEEALVFHGEMWVFVHGVATMVATAYLDWENETISRMLTDVYQGIKGQYRSKREK